MQLAQLGAKSLNVPSSKQVLLLLLLLLLLVCLLLLLLLMCLLLLMLSLMRVIMRMLMLRLLLLIAGRCLHLTVHFPLTRKSIFCLIHQGL